MDGQTDACELAGGSVILVLICENISTAEVTYS